MARHSGSVCSRSEARQSGSQAALSWLAMR
jgi:hypothetical protein